MRCPLPYMGEIGLYCGISGMEVTSGRCLRQCPGGSYFDRTFEVYYPASYHGELTSADCPRGAQGNITMLCLDGEAKYHSGRCGYNCQPGSLRAGSGIVMYPEMIHQTERSIRCDRGWTGSPKVRCFDSMVTLTEGVCMKHCGGGVIPLEDGSLATFISHGPVDHATSVMADCPSAEYSGQIMLQCYDGELTLNRSNGTCYRHCAAGNVSSYGDPQDYISARRNVSHGMLLHGTEASLECNKGYWTYPEDQILIIGKEDLLMYRSPLKIQSASSGFGVVVNEYKQVLSVAVAATTSTSSWDAGVVYQVMYVVGAEDNLLYRQPLTSVHPTSTWGEPINEKLIIYSIFAADGIMYATGHLPGEDQDTRAVFQQELSSMKVFTEWTRISPMANNVSAVVVSGDGTIYGALEENNRIYRLGGMRWRGPLSIINVLPITSIQLVGDVLYAIANEQIYYQSFSAMTTQTEWLGPISGEQRIVSLGMELVDKSEAPSVWVPGFVGTLEIECDDGSVNLLDGACMLHCTQGVVITNNIVIEHPNMSHGENISLICPPTHTGLIVTFCVDGVVYGEGTCGLNCPAQEVESNDALVEIPMLNHSDDPNHYYTIPCPSPYRAVVLARCFMGELRWSGVCMKACPAGVWERQSATVAYPELNHTDTYSGPCVPKYPQLSYSGNVSFVCENGFVNSEGGCYSDCTPGEIEDNAVPVAYGFIPVGTSALVACTPSAMFGTVEIACNQGYPEIIDGTCGQPCRSSVYNSAFTRDWDLEMPDIAHMGSAAVTCPAQVSGTLQFSCYNKILSVDSGSCGERCMSKALDVYGASFVTPMMVHLENYTQPCMVPYYGDVFVSCAYGKLNITSRCQQGCWAGNMSIQGGARLFYPAMISGEQYSTQCPGGYAGFVTLECGDIMPFVASGACYKHCQAARYFQENWNVEHDLIYHTDTAEYECHPDYDGYVILKCDAGTVSLEEGGCYKRCVNGRYSVRIGIALRHAQLGHGELSPSMQCPEGYVGSVRLLCTHGVVSVGEGGCPAHCASGIIQGANYKYMLHTENASLVCPIAGSIDVGCLDGTVSVFRGACYTGCGAGSMFDVNGSLIEYPGIDHLGVVTGTCAGSSTGFVQVNCSDGEAMLDPLLGQRCVKHCQGGNLTTSDGTRIASGDLMHGQQNPIKCPGGKIGSVTVRCSDGLLYIASGNCGPTNCPAGSTTVWQTDVPYPEINDGEETEKPSECPGTYIGAATFSCSNASVSVLNVSVVYPAIPGLSAVHINLSNLSQEDLLWHEDDYFELCGCCIPADQPPGAAPIPGVDLRKIIVWALTTAAAGVVLAAVSGFVVMRPQRCRRGKKASQIHPKDAIEDASKGQESTEVVPYQEEANEVVPYKPVRQPYNKPLPPDW